MGDLYLRLSRKHQLQNASHVSSSNRFPRESTERTSKDEVGKLQNECRVKAKRDFTKYTVRLRSWGNQVSQACFYTRQQKVQSLPIIPECSIFLMHQMKALACVVITYMAKKSTTRKSPQTPTTSGYISKGIGSRVSKRYLHTHVHYSIIYNSQQVKTTQVSTNR